MERTETRTVDVNLDQVRTEGNTLRGHAAVFNVLSEALPGGFREKIAPGAFAGVLDADVRLLVNHDPDRVLARTKSGTLAIAEDDKGLAFTATLPDTTYASDLRKSIKRGDVDGCSFRFQIGEEAWDGDVREVRSVKALHDLTIATVPAYPQTSLELRTREPANDSATEPEKESKMEDRESSGLAVEQRTARDTGEGVEARVIEAMRSVPRGECRSLTTADNSAGPVTPPETSTMLWDRLRDVAVVLQSGVPIISTDRTSVQWPTLVSDIEASFYDELDEIDASDPGFDQFDVTPKAIKALVRGSSEAFEDSDPDLLRIVQQNLVTILGLKLDRELIVGGSAKGFDGMLNVSGTTTIDAAGALDDYDPILRAVGVLAGSHVPPPYAVIAHPWTITHLDLLKRFTGNTESNEQLARPAAVPPFFATTQVGRDDGADTSTLIVFAPAQVPVVRRRDTTVEVDRSAEFTTDAVLVRGKLRACSFFPYPQAIVKLENVPAPDPSE